MIITPTHFEICDDDRQVIAKVKMFEGGCAASVEVVTLVDEDSWIDVSAAIRDALVKMKLGEA